MSYDLKQVSTRPPKGTDKLSCQRAAKKLKEKLNTLQEKLFAQNRASLLVILQGMDTSGKDNAVKHIFSGVNPSGCRVKSFKVPSEEENAHHFLWRVSKECPETRYIQIFNRSQYEHVLENVINNRMDEATMKSCLQEINAFEKGLELHGTHILKFYLHVSQEVQQERYEVRKNDPEKQWKFQLSDKQSIARHDEYAKIYESIFEQSNEVEWRIIPSDKKWYKNYLILKTVVEALEELVMND